MKSSGYALIFLVLALIAGGLYYFYSQSNQNKLNSKSWQGSDLSNQQQVENGESNKFSLVEPEKMNLTDPSGGDNSGIANRIYNNSQFIHTVTANLPKIENGQSYQGWLIKKDQSNRIAIGTLEENNDEYYLEFKSNTDYSDHPIVSITLNEKEQKEPGEEVLTGEFSAK